MAPPRAGRWGGGAGLARPGLVAGRGAQVLPASAAVSGPRGGAVEPGGRRERLRAVAGTGRGRSGAVKGAPCGGGNPRPPSSSRWDSQGAAASESAARDSDPGRWVLLFCFFLVCLFVFNPRAAPVPSSQQARLAGLARSFSSHGSWKSHPPLGPTVLVSHPKWECEVRA